MAGVLDVPVVRLDPDLPLPAYARPGDAGADLSPARASVLAAGGGRALVPTGIALAIPEGYAGFVQPRSGLALRHGVTCLNTPGLIDAGYRDELRVLLVNTDPDGRLRGRAAATASPSWSSSGSSRPASPRSTTLDALRAGARAASATPGLTGVRSCRSATRTQCQSSSARRCRTGA